MIRIYKCAPPAILDKKKTEWTNALLKAISDYKGYKNIPNEIKQKLLAPYRNPDIQNALSDSSHGKCAFCESRPSESGYMEVEHLIPKSIYPEYAFEWDNLFPICRKCNGDKLAYDTVKNPVIDPSKDNPEELLTYANLVIKPVKGTHEEQKAKRTIRAYNLNSPRLYEVRAELLIALTEYIDEVSNQIELIDEADTKIKRKKRIVGLRNSLDKIDKLLRDDSTYAGYCRWFILSNPIYLQAKKVIDDYDMEE